MEKDEDQIVLLLIEWRHLNIVHCIYNLAEIAETHLLEHTGGCNSPNTGVFTKTWTNNMAMVPNSDS